MLPPALLNAISAPAGGQVVLVVGAGCSKDPPTGLPVARELSQSCHDSLVRDGFLAVGDCSDPSDLSALADAVVLKTGDQTPLVRAMNPDRFRTARANDGYKQAAALLIEGSLSCVLTLNFDTALIHALAELGQHDVAVIEGPEEHNKLSLRNIIYLHRSAFSPPGEWILTTSALSDGWKDRWQQIIANRVLVSPVVLFVGLGSLAGVLTETIKKIRASLPAIGQTVYQVDRSPRERSPFFQLLDLPDQNYIQSGWLPFMRELSDRVLKEQVADLQVACETMKGRDGRPEVSTEEIQRELLEIGLVAFGAVRSRMFMNHEGYTSAARVNVSHIADLLFGVAAVAAYLQARTRFRQDGAVIFIRDEAPLVCAFLISGQGVKTLLAVDAVIREHVERSAFYPAATIAIAAGCIGGTPSRAELPNDIVAEPEDENIADPTGAVNVISVLDLWSTPDMIADYIK